RCPRGAAVNANPPAARHHAPRDHGGGLAMRGRRAASPGRCRSRLGGPGRAAARAHGARPATAAGRAARERRSALGSPWFERADVCAAGHGSCCADGCAPGGARYGSRVTIPDLASLRDAIESLDRRLLALLAERMQLSEAVAGAKLA